MSNKISFKLTNPDVKYTVEPEASPWSLDLALIPYGKILKG